MSACLIEFNTCALLALRDQMILVYLFIYLPAVRIGCLVDDGKSNSQTEAEHYQQEEDSLSETSLELYKRCGRFAIKLKLFHSPIGEKSA